MGNFQKYWSQNVGQDFIVLDFFVGGISCGRKRCVREINVSHAWDPVHAGDKALMREIPVKRGRVNRYAFTSIFFLIKQEIYYYESQGGHEVFSCLINITHKLQKLTLEVCKCIVIYAIQICLNSFKREANHRHCMMTKPQPGKVE